MEEFFAALLSGLVELLLEALFQFVLEIVVSLIARAFRNLVSGFKFDNPVLAAMGYLVLGIVFGAGSSLVLPHPLFHPSRIHGLSLIVSPLLTGLAMSRVGATLRGSGRESVRIESFVYGFTFAFGFALMRFLLAA
jgi:hypothetical protein